MSRSVLASFSGHLQGRLNIQVTVTSSKFNIRITITKFHMRNFGKTNP
jgi:hypothetical protein